MQPDVLAADRDLFRDSVEDHLTDDIYTIRQWVLSHRQIIHRSRREARHRSTQTIKLLPKYFHPLKSGKRKRKYYKSAPTPVPIYESTRMSDHFPHTPSLPAPVARTDQQLSHLVDETFNNSLLSSAGTIQHRLVLYTCLLTTISWRVCFQLMAETR